MDRLNYINPANADYINSLYEAYKQDPESVDFGWQKFFEGFDFGQGAAPQVAAAGATATPHGTSPTGMRPITLRVCALTTVTSLEGPLAV